MAKRSAGKADHLARRRAGKTPVALVRLQAREFAALMGLHVGPQAIPRKRFGHPLEISAERLELNEEGRRGQIV